MLRGKTEAETLALNGWTVGDILEGKEGNRVDKIMITAIGHSEFLCRWKRQGDVEFRPEGGFLTTLNAREWRKVGRVEP